MSRFFDSSIISGIPQDPQTEPTSTNQSEPRQQSFTFNSGIDPITQFLQAAETKRDEEESDSYKSSAFFAESQPSAPPSTNQSSHHSRTSSSRMPAEDLDFNPAIIAKREFLIEDIEFDFKPVDKIRYQPSDILAVRPFAVAPPSDKLPDKSYYRIGHKLQQQNTTHTRRKPQNGGSGGRGGNYESTGAMGNFNLKNNGRNYNGRGKRGAGRRKNENDDQWLDELMNQLDPNASPEDFDLLKAKFNNEQRRKRGEIVPEEREILEEPKNTIDNFFNPTRPHLHDQASSASVSALTSADAGNINSKFFSFFNNPESAAESLEQQPQQQEQPVQESKEGISKILSLLDKGEKAAGQQESSKPSSTRGSQFFSQQAKQLPPGLSPSLQSQNSSQPPPGLSPPRQLQQAVKEQPEQEQSQQQNQQSQQSQPQFPPGLGPSIGLSGNKESSFFNSLLHKHEQPIQPTGTDSPKPSKDEGLKQSVESSPAQPPRSANQTPTVPSQTHQQQNQPLQASPQLQPQQQPPKQFQGPPGFQQGPPPGFQGNRIRNQQQPPQNQQQQQRGGPNQQQSIQPGQLPPLPQGFNPQQLPPNFDPRQLPPWIQQQFQQGGIPGPNGPQQNGQFLPPMPNGQRFPPPQMPPHLYNPQMGPPPPQFQQNGPSQPQGAVGGSNGTKIPPHLLFQQQQQQQQQQQTQQGNRQLPPGVPPPGFFNGMPPPPGFFNGMPPSMPFHMQQQSGIPQGLSQGSNQQQTHQQAQPKGV